MHGEALAYPFSTYAVGKQRSSVRYPLLDRNFTIQALVMVATISVVAITFGPGMTTEAPSAPVGRPSALGSRAGYAASAVGTGPARDWTLAGLQVDASNLSIHTVQHASVRPRTRAAPLVLARMHSSPKIAVSAPLVPPEEDLGGNVSRPHIGPTDDGTVALAKCSSRCSPLEPPVGDTAQVSMDIVAIATGVATPAGAGEIRQDPAAADVVAPSRQPLPADSDQDELIPAGVLASDPAPAEPSIGPAIGEPAYEADIAPANFPNSPADGRSLGNQGEQTTAPGLPKAMAAVGAVDTAPGGTATAMSAHLARIRERYPDGPRQQDVVTKSAHRAEAARPVLVDTTLGDAPVTQKVGSTIIIQDDELVAIKLSELISLFETRLDRSLFVWMRTASAASKFVTADTLASAGIEAHYDSTSRQLVLSVNSE